MLSFELSVFDLVLSVGVIVLIVLFLTTLVKLNPSSESKGSGKARAYEEEQELAESSHDLDQLNPPILPPTTLRSTEKAIPDKSQPPRLMVSPTTSGSYQESLEQAPRSSEYKEQPKNNKAAGANKQAPKNTDDKDCLHFFGYLGGLPKNTSIPGECFGCPKIVDCLIATKRRS